MEAAETAAKKAHGCHHSTAGLLVAAMKRTLAPQEVTFDKEEKQKREENRKRFPSPGWEV